MMIFICKGNKMQKQNWQKRLSLISYLDTSTNKDVLIYFQCTHSFFGGGRGRSLRGRNPTVKNKLDVRFSWLARHRQCPGSKPCCELFIPSATLKVRVRISNSFHVHCILGCRQLWI